MYMSNFKSLRAATAALILVGASAGIAHADSVFDGVTLGVDGGFAYGTADDYNGSGFSGGASVGYGHVTGKNYTGLELRGELSNLELEDNGHAITKKQSFGGTLKVGRVVSKDAIVYGLTGYDRALFEVEGGSDVWANGISGGLGFEKAITGGVSMKTEGRYTRWMSDGFNDNPNELGARVGLSYRW